MPLCDGGGACCGYRGGARGCAVPPGTSEGASGALGSGGFELATAWCCTCVPGLVVFATHHALYVPVTAHRGERPASCSPLALVLLHSLLLVLLSLKGARSLSLSVIPSRSCSIYRSVSVSSPSPSPLLSLALALALSSPPLPLPLLLPLPLSPLSLPRISPVDFQEQARHLHRVDIDKIQRQL